MTSAPAPVLVYDGGCPFCRHFAERLELTEALPGLQLRDGRADTELRHQLRRRGCDLAQGAVLIEGERLHHGAEAIGWVCGRLQPSDALLQVLHTVFAQPATARGAYPLLLLARRLALAALGLPLDPDHAPTEPPDGATLLALERRSRQQGSGLGASQLSACWWLQSVWPRGREHSDGLSSALLRGLGARLELRPREGAPAEELEITNAVGLGALELRFRGTARLVGRRPLLRFGFERVELRLGTGEGARVLLGRDLPPPASARQEPFFALIAAEDHWLAARGRGGGLARWRRRSGEPQQP
ncbi:MAG: hypothetical protein ACOVNL_02670 [Prochlorococcaceae cyanobacterium]